MANEGQHRLTQAHSNQRRPMQAYEDENWPKRPYLHHYPHHHQPPTITTTTSPPAAPAAPPAPPSPGLKTRLGPFFRHSIHHHHHQHISGLQFLFIYFISYFTGAEMRLGPLFVLF